MNLRQTDALVGILVLAVIVVGGALSLDAYQQQKAIDAMGSMMGTSMDAMHGTNPIWFVVGTILLSALIGGGYLVIRSERTDTDTAEKLQGGMAMEAETDRAEPSEGSDNSISRPLTRVLDLLPDDERRILEPVLASPGITQIELRDRSDFSKSKVSQTVSALEKRGLLYRERQGRTFRIYPSDDLQQNHATQ